MQIITKNCIVCGQEYIKKPFYSKTLWELSKYCSRRCSAKGSQNAQKLIGIKRSPETIAKMRGKRPNFTPWNKGKVASEETKQKIREARKRQVITSDQARRSIETRKARYGYTHSPKAREKLKEHFTGANSHWWLGGKSTEAHKIRESAEYRAWRSSVFKRDDWTCRSCGYKGNKLEADHIKPFAHFPELRLELSNGRTLCIPCHKQTDTYGKNYKPI